jgi:hypothetical protein
MELIFGFLLGRVVSSKDGFLALILFPFVIALFIGVVVLFTYGANWYEAGAALQSPTSAWYAWPWDWPGIQIAQMVLDWWNKSIDGAFGFGAVATKQEAVFSFEFIARWFHNVIGAMLAVFINLFVATIPIYGLGTVFRVRNLIRGQMQKGTHKIKEVSYE